MPMNQDYTPAQMTQMIDELRGQVTQLAQANTTLVNNEHAIRQELAELRELSWDTQSSRVLESSEPVPEVTISHDMLANGTWRYKTSVTMPLDLNDPRLVTEALERVDQLAKAESQRRMREIG